MESPLVIHVPHASTLIPPDVRGQFLLDQEALDAEARESADLWTDMLARAAWPEAKCICASVSRIVVDVERYADDAMEPMAGVGRGMIYTRTHDGAPLRQKLSDNERVQLQAEYYDPHWARLREAAAGAILIDLHSYPVEPWAVELDAAADRPEIDLGTEISLTPDSWRDALVEHFAGTGYSGGLNHPYAGVIDAGAAVAIMVEIRRDMFGLGPTSPEWNRLVGALRSAPLPSG